MLPEKLLGIIGHPLEHSLSPLLHSTAFQVLGWPGVLLRWPLPPEHLKEFMHAMRILHIHGCAVTIPHKMAVLSWLDTISDSVRTVGACNTLYWKDGALCGENTDVTGFITPLSKRPAPATALVLGAGGAAKAIVAGLHMLGVRDVSVTARRFEALASFCGACGARPVAWERRGDAPADIIVNTTPLGMRGLQENVTPFPQDLFSGRPTGIAYDIVYTPLETRFLREARACGWEGIDGLAMFIAQAAQQFALWTGGLHLPDAAVLAVRQKLACT